MSHFMKEHSHSIRYKMKPADFPTGILSEFPSLFMKNFKTRHLQYQIDFDGSSLVFSDFFSQTALKFCQLPGFDS